VPDAQSLETQAVVLDRGVQIGNVASVSVHGSSAEVTLRINSRYAPLYRDATVRVGQRTAIGDAFVDVVRGTRADGGVANGGAIFHALPNVDFDEAFSTFNAPTRRNMTALIRTFGAGARSPETAQQWGGTVAGLSRVVTETAHLATALKGQKAQIATLVDDSDVAVTELGSRQAALTSLVDAGQKTLAVFAGDQSDFGTTLQRLPALLSAARQTLAIAQPLIVQAKPLVADLSDTAPLLRSAAAAVPATARDARAVVSGLPRLDHVALPFLSQALPVIRDAGPFARNLLPLLQNSIPILDYASPRADDLAGWFTKTLSGGLQGDAKGHWVRFLIFIDPQVVAGIDRGAQYRNPYPSPQDAENPQPFTGTYPRLQPYFPHGTTRPIGSG
jgi:phospholipid/cholesterol/gamma-HCH transport system substrate-binding protein